jgi:prolyl oligopeptidase
MPIRYCILNVLLLAACGGATPNIDMPTADTPEVNLPTDELASLNRAARQGAVVETLHGQEVSDPYRALEDDNDATWAWIDAQTARTQAYLEQNSDPTRAERIEALLSIGYFGEVHQAGGRVFFTKREGDAEQAILYVLEGDSEPRVLVDPNALGERIAIDWLFVSPNGTYVAYGLSSGGDERSTLHVVDAATGEVLSEEITHTKWTSLDWLRDESGFYYTRYPMPGEEDYDEENEDSYNAHLFHHELGADHTGDSLIFRVPEPTHFVFPQVSDDDAWVVLTLFRSWSESDLYIVDNSGEVGGNVHALVVGGDYLIYGGVHQGRMLLFSNQDHSRGRLIAGPVSADADLSSFGEVVPEGEGTIEGFYLAGERIVVSYVEDISALLRLYELDGTPAGEIELPTRGGVGSIATSPDSERVVFTFDSYFYPPTLYAYENGELTQLARVEADIDTADFELETVTVTSEDGTPINVYLVHRSDMVRDGTQPVLLGGYGGFNVSRMPGFQRNVIYWLSRGGVYASANIRGGGEFGEDWHADGMLQNKHHVFEDFEAVIRWLSTSGISNPARIAIMGGSNGGLLMGAMVTRCPDAFRVAISSVGLYDMVRFTEFPPAEIWMGEYGDPAEADAFEYLYDYSPYHNVELGTAYPAIFIATADQDTRVSWQHSTKFTALLQEATTSDRPVLFYMSRDAGHGAGSGVSDIVDRYVRYYTVIETELGVTPD